MSMLFVYTILQTNVFPVLFIDLIKNYNNLLPPTIEKKKRESERRLLVRKRTAPVDMRMSRGRISVGTPTREILAAQEAAQKVAMAHSSPVAGSGVAKLSTSPIQVTAEPESMESASATEAESEHESEIETESEAQRQSVPDPAEDNDAPPRPTFREPPPELDDMPPRPSFREPPPELDDGPHASTLPPAFVSPPASPAPVTVSVAEGRITPSSSHSRSPPVSVTPATPQNPIKALRRNSAVRSSGSVSPARSPSPAMVSARSAVSAAATEDQPLNLGRANLSRNTTGQAVGGLRGPRMTRGPRTPGGGSVSSMVSNFNNRVSTTSPPPSPGYKRLSGGSRPGSTFGGSGVPARVGARGGLSRRTMASDAEDEVVDK